MGLKLNDVLSGNFRCVIVLVFLHGVGPEWEVGGVSCFIHDNTQP